MEALRVVAHLQNAYTSSDPWSPSLEGILAYWHLRERLGEEEFALGMTGHRPLVEPDLPLAREDEGEIWWWVCSSPIVGGAAVRFDRYTHRRFDLGAAVDVLPETTRKVLAAGGPYKAYRNRETATVPADNCLTWHCVGDAGEIARLLRRCAGVGRGIGRGSGVVTRWEVTPDGADEVLARFHRPLPAAFAVARGITGTVLDWGIRPPGRAPEHRTRCVLPVSDGR